MKPWQWILLAGGAVVVIVLIMRQSSSAQQSGAVNTNLVAAAGLGGLLAGVFRGTGSGTKVSAPVAGNGIPGDTGYSYNGLSPTAYGQQYSAAMGGTGYSASESAGHTSSSGAAAGAASGQAGYDASVNAAPYTPPSADPLGVGTLQAPSFDVGTGGADFSN